MNISVEVTHHRYNGEEYKTKDSIESYTEDALLKKESGESLRLGRQPATVALALGRLLEVLLRKNLLTDAEFFEVLGDGTQYWGSGHPPILREEEE